MRSIDNSRDYWRTPVRSRTASSQRCTPVRTEFRQSGSSGILLPLRHQHCAKPASKILGTSCCHQPWLASGSRTANARKPMASWHQCTGGSPRGLIRRICRMPKPCSMSWEHSQEAQRHSLWRSIWVGTHRDCWFAGFQTRPYAKEKGPLGGKMFAPRANIHPANLPNPRLP